MPNGRLWGHDRNGPDPGLRSPAPALVGEAALLSRGDRARLVLREGRCIPDCCRLAAAPTSAAFGHLRRLQTYPSTYVGSVAAGFYTFSSGQVKRQVTPEGV
jgi:hypothetical protein